MTRIARKSPRCRKTGAASIPALRRRGIRCCPLSTRGEGKENTQRKWPREGPFHVAPLVPVVTVTALDDHDLVAMVPAAMPAMVAMLAEFGAGAVRAVMMMTALDHHSLRACQRRHRNRERAHSGNDITKLPHDVLLQSNAKLNLAFA